mgnify:CR=1 FL=1
MSSSAMQTSEAITQLMLETFRLNGALLAAGDELVADLGLTSARWQVLGAVMLEGRAQTVAQIARRMGLSRQAVQRVVNDLSAEDIVRPADNPDHKRAPLIEATARGEATYATAMERQDAWAVELAQSFKASEMQTALSVMRRMAGLCGAAPRPGLPAIEAGARS